jgi:hypothetical protein
MVAIDRINNTVGTIKLAATARSAFTNTDNARAGYSAG